MNPKNTASAGSAARCLCRRAGRCDSRAWSWDGENLVSHDPRCKFEPVQGARLDGDPEQRQFRRVAGEAANRNGVERFEMLVLHDDGRSRLSAIIYAARVRPNLAAPQSSCPADI